jgi:hypothetical protein
MKWGAVILRTDNKRDRTRHLVSKAQALPLEPQTIVVGDNSGDGTGARADDVAVRFAGVQAVPRPKKRGLATAHMSGIRSTLTSGDTCTYSCARGI